MKRDIDVVIILDQANFSTLLTITVLKISVLNEKS